MATRSGQYWLRRIERHFVLAVIAVALTAFVYHLTPPPDFRHRLSMGSAYAALIFLACTLWLGPWNVLRRRANPVSFDLRRDIGIWAGLLAVFHTGIGLTVHLRGRMWMYFFKQLHPLKIQNTQFGLANYTGLIAALIFVLLLILSNDASLRRLGMLRWKYLQRYIYLAFALTVLHGALFQAIESRHISWVIFFSAVIAAVAAFQMAAFYRKRSGAKGRRPV